MNFLTIIGETTERFVSNAVRSSDGSWIGIQTDKPSYYAGETITGFIIVSLNSPRQCDKVLLKVTVKEDTYWDEEITRTYEEGEGDQKRRRTVYEHKQCGSKEKILKEMVLVSTLPHVLMPGAYKYPFQYALGATLPGVAKFNRQVGASDPAWQSLGRKLVTRGSICYKLGAIFDVNGVFSRDLKCKQEIIVNPRFDWSKMSPAAGKTTAEVRLFCCIPRGPMELSASFDKAAYAAGETAVVKANINNGSEQEVKAMVVKLMRFISLQDSAGHKKEITDVVARASFPGVPPKTEKPQDMPLLLSNQAGALLTATRGKRMQVTYRFDVECALSCCPDVEVHMPMIIYSPAPAVWGLQSMGLQMPAALDVPGYHAAAMPITPAVTPQQILMPQQPAYGYPSSPSQSAEAFPGYTPQPGMYVPGPTMVQPKSLPSPAGYPPQQYPAQQPYPAQQYPAAGGYPPQQSMLGQPPVGAGGYPPQAVQQLPSGYGQQLPYPDQSAG